MKTADIVRLVTLAAIWGCSFIFMRVLSPALGPVTTACSRVLIAGIVLSLYFRIIKFNVGWKKDWRHFFAIGMISSALPFLLFAFAALHIPASLSAIFNSSSPLFGAIFAAIWLNDSLSPQKIVGLLLGSIGVGLVAVKGAIVVGEFGLIASIACLGAAICYGLAAVYIKKFASHINPLAIAGASQLSAGLILLPFISLAPPHAEINLTIVLNILGLSLFCSGLAYILYYRLIADIGPSKALTVTFLIPVFGLLWAVIFLHEVITIQMLAGCALIVAGTTLVLVKRNRAAA